MAPAILIMARLFLTVAPAYVTVAPGSLNRLHHLGGPFSCPDAIAGAFRPVQYWNARVDLSYECGWLVNHGYNFLEIVIFFIIKLQPKYYYYYHLIIINIF